ncbi:MAG: methylmalonyl-CoA epimerase [Atribacterota bacterium]|nr:methylmalonyl-CoA epimerase [Atribacterota bacterium]MDD4363058.1 methylmalonyl-CoA epimerase [Atribacterota bacterium]
MFNKISHIGIAVKNIEDSISVFKNILGVECKGEEVVDGQNVKVAFLPVGDSEIELLESTSTDGKIAKFIEKNGEGVHHIAFEVKNLEAKLVDLEKKGFQLIDKKPRCGAGGARIAFLHPQCTSGVLIELCEHNS